MTVWDFVKRHKGKIIAGGVLIGGALTYASQSLKHGNQAMLIRSYETDSLKIQARRHYVFDTNQRSCDQSLTDLVPSIKALVQSRFDVDILIKELQNNFDMSSQQKIEIWQKIKDGVSAKLFIYDEGFSSSRDISIPQLLDLAERMTIEECSDISLMNGVNKEDVRSILDRIDRRLAVADSRHFSQFIAPLYEKDVCWEF
uniref:Peroxisomal biogenesis factor 3 n=1 Tax=Heterorhabditis bacteriophora TaxID=37862 RepID=A0A1I7XU73_HETBA